MKSPKSLPWKQVRVHGSMGKFYEVVEARDTDLTVCRAHECKQGDEETEFIVMACNAHDDLLAACVSLLPWAALACARDNPKAVLNAVRDIRGAMAAIERAGGQHNLRLEGLDEIEREATAKLEGKQ